MSGFVGVSCSHGKLKSTGRKPVKCGDYSHTVDSDEEWQPGDCNESVGAKDMIDLTEEEDDSVSCSDFEMAICE